MLTSDPEYRALQSRLAALAGALGESDRAILSDIDSELRQLVALRRGLQRAQFRRSFVSKAAKLLGSSLDYTDTVASVCRLLVPDLADWSAIDLLDEDGTLRRIEVCHSDPEKVALAHELHQKYPPGPNDPILRAVRTGTTEFVPALADEILALLAHDEEHLAVIRSLGLRSYLVVPLLARNRTLGALTLVVAESQREYEDADLAIAEELAAIAALAIDNARLFRDVEASETRFRELVDTLGAIVWEGDPVTFQFTLVSKRAEQILGYPRERWLEPGFWASIVAPEMRSWAVNYCASATSEGRDHEFDYAAIAADGRRVWLRDIVYVLRDEKGRARKLRGVMVEIPAKDVETQNVTPMAS